MLVPRWKYRSYTNLECMQPGMVRVGMMDYVNPGYGAFIINKFTAAHTCALLVEL